MGSGYEVSVQDMLRVVGQLDGLVADYARSVQDLEAVTTPVAAYGQVGTVAARVTRSTTSDQLMMMLTQITSSVKELSRRVETSADGYAALDRQIADALARMRGDIKPVPEIPQY